MAFEMSAAVAAKLSFNVVSNRNPGSISPTYLRSAFTLADPESIKRLMT